MEVSPAILRSTRGLKQTQKILQKTHGGTSFSNVDRISTAHFHAPYALEMHELGVTGSLSAVWPSSDDRFFNNHGKYILNRSCMSHDFEVPGVRYWNHVQQPSW